MPNLRYFYQVLNGATYKVFGYPHWGTNKWRHKYDSYNLNHGIKFSDGKLAGYLKISIIFSLTERLRSFLQNRRFLREFHYGLGILKTISLKLIRSDTFYDIHIIYMHLNVLSCNLKSYSFIQRFLIARAVHTSCLAQAPIDRKNECDYHAMYKCKGIWIWNTYNYL